MFPSVDLRHAFVPATHHLLPATQSQKAPSSFMSASVAWPRALLASERGCPSPKLAPSVPPTACSSTIAALSKRPFTFPSTRLTFEVFRPPADPPAERARDRRGAQAVRELLRGAGRGAPRPGGDAEPHAGRRPRRALRRPALFCSGQVSLTAGARTAGGAGQVPTASCAGSILRRSRSRSHRSENEA